jgi:hypothetical protein
MAKRNKFFRKEVLPLGQQVIRMQLEWPEFKGAIKRAEASWVGQITPTKMSDTYTIRVTYQAPRRPVVEVISPALRALPNKRIPHTFPGEKLCLHLPGQWTPNMFIASTVIRWLALWLFFYETWLITGNWEGGGEEPQLGKKK